MQMHTAMISGPKGWPGYAVAYPKRPTPAHSRACNQPALPSPSKRRHADTTEKEKKERRGLRLPHAITRRLRDRPSAHGSPPLGVAQQHSRTGCRRAGRRLAVLVASHPRGPKTPTRSVHSAVSCELLACVHIYFSCCYPPAPASAGRRPSFYDMVY